MTASRRYMTCLSPNPASVRMLHLRVANRLEIMTTTFLPYRYHLLAADSDQAA